MAGDKSSVKVWFLGEVSNLAAAARKARGELAQVSQQANDSGGRIRGAFLTMGKVAAGFATAAGGAAVAGGALGLKTAASMEQARISFETMLGSAQKADRFLKDLSAFAAKTPFEFPELQTAASSLVSAGIEADKVIPIMTTLGDVTSGMGTGSEGVQRATVALQQMNAAGRITGEDLNQLRDAGIPVYDLLAKATGKSKAEVVKLAQAGKLGSKELGQMMKALETGKGLERFSGLMDKQSQSLSGLWSTFKDTLGMGLSNLITPAIPGLKKGLAAASTAVGSAFTRISQFFKGVSSGSGEGGSAFQRFGASVRKATTWISANVMPVLRALGGWVMGSLVPTFQKVAGDVMPKVRAAFQSIGKTINDNRSTFEKIGNVFQALIIVLGAVARVVLTVLGPAFRLLVGLIDKLVLPAIRLIADVFLGVVGAIVNGAAKAFGWVPGIGDKLKGAAKSFNKFRDEVKAALDGTAQDAKLSANEIANGLIHGLRAKTPEMMRQAHKLGGAAANAIRHGAEVSSPSRITTYVGKMLAEGLIVGIRARGSKAVEAAKKLAKQVADIAARVIAPLDRAIERSKDRLKSLRDSSRQLAETARDNARSYASILGFQAEEGKQTTAGDVLASMRDRLKKLQEFRVNLAKLAKMGLNNTTYQQLLEAGVEGGGTVASALLAGGGGAVGQANQIQGDINAASNALGAGGANKMYGASIKAEEARLAKLLATRKAWNKTEITIKVEAGVDNPTAVAKRLQALLLKLKRENGGNLGLA